MKSKTTVEKTGAFKKTATSGRIDPFFQPKLTIGAADDRYEKEADEVAEKVMRAPDQAIGGPSFVHSKPVSVSSLVNRKCTSCEEESRGKENDEKDHIQADEKVSFEHSGEDNSLKNIQRKPGSGNLFFKPLNTCYGDTVQRKCKACDEEKIQRQEDETEGPSDQSEQTAGALPDEIEGGGIVQRAIGQPGTFFLQRKCTDCEEEEGGIQRKESDPGAGGGEVPSVVGEALSSPGQSMDGNTLSFMESRFGYDLSNVRIHTGSLAAQSAQSINALAYTSGNNVVFNEGQYAPETDSGKKLLAHELTHVIQQSGGLQRKKQYDQAPDATITTPISSVQHAPVQRFIFWHEFKGGVKPRTGTEIHNEITPAMAGSAAEREAPIPNANREGAIGFGENGRADFYKAKRRIGVYFKHPVVAVCDDGKSLGTPNTLRGGGANPSPRVSKGKITIGDAPDSVTLGELKPSTPDMIRFGKEQLEHYEKGIKFAAHQTNCWSAKNHDPSKGTAAPQWAFTGTPHFDNGSLPVPDQFKPGSTGQNRNLGVVDFVGMDEFDRSAIKPEFTPRRDVGFDVKGGLYAQHAGSGVIGYYFYPDDPAGVLKQLSIDPKDAKVKAYAEFAAHLHKEIIQPLFTGPAKVQPKRKPDAPVNVSQDHKNLHPVQRKVKKNSKLKDDFKLAEWNRNHQKHQDNFNKKLKETREALQLTELLYKGEDAAKKMNVGVKALPPKSSLNIEIDTNDPKKKETKNLSSLYSWMNLWAKEPMKFIGKLRDKFGGAFVAVTNRFALIKRRFANLLRKSRDKNEPKGLSYGAIAVRAFWRAMVKAGDLIFDETIELLVASLESGLKNKVQQLIPLDPEKLSEMADQNFPQLKELEKKIESLEKEVETRLGEINKKFENELEMIKEIAKDAETLGTIIKWAVVALNCASPPGWGCLKLLAKKLIAKMVDEILKWCPVQKEFSQLVAGMGFVQGLPKTAAGIAADFIESLLPPAINPIFDRTVFDKSTGIKAEDIKCDDGISEEQKALVELEEKLKAKLGEDGFMLLLEALRKYGISPEDPLLASEIREMIERIPDGVTAVALQTYIASNPRPEKGKGQIFDVAEFLEIVNRTTLPQDFRWFVVAHPPGQGHTKGESVKVNVSISPVRPCTQWSVITSFDVPARVSRRIFYEAKKMQIFYKASQSVAFQISGQSQEIKAGTEFWGYRPDACKN